MVIENSDIKRQKKPIIIHGLIFEAQGLRVGHVAEYRKLQRIVEKPQLQAVQRSAAVPQVYGQAQNDAAQARNFGESAE
jgi:hypothetical protein